MMLSMLEGNKMRIYIIIITYSLVLEVWDIVCNSDELSKLNIKKNTLLFETLVFR